jgi:predicted PurR-regulated permease PerM
MNMPPHTGVPEQLPMLTPESSPQPPTVAAGPESAAPPQPSSIGNSQAAPGLNVITAAVVLLTIATLYFGRDIFIPFALAVLLSFMLAPPVDWLRRIRVPRAPAVLLVVGFAFSLIGALSVFVGSQMVDIAKDLPTYQSAMREKIRSIRSVPLGGGVIDRTTEAIAALGAELSAAPAASATGKSAAAGRPKREPVPVQIEAPDQKPLDMIQTVVGPLLGPLGTAGLVIIFIFFVLLEPSNLRDRFIRLAGGNLHRTTEAISEAAQRVSRYLLMQLIVNVTYGIPLGIGLYIIGVPSAFLWALLAMLLRFVPYLGPFIAALFPVTLAFVVDPGWSMLLWTVALILGIELISNNVIEPWLYGSSTGLTPVAVILAAIFWTLLWGPVGLFLAMPLTVCLVVMGRYVPQLEFLDVLLGSDPVLTPAERLYQRLLAGNVEEAIEIAELHVAENSLPAFYDQVGLPALRLAENARQHGASTEDRQKVADGVRAIVLELKAQDEKAAREDSEQQTPGGGAFVLCIAGRGELDAAAAAMLVHELKTRGIGARPVPASAVTLETIGHLALDGVTAVCFSYLNPTPQVYARFVCRRLKRRMPHLKIVLGLWNLGSEAGSAEQLAAGSEADAAAATLDEAVRLVEGMVMQPVPAAGA